MLRRGVQGVVGKCNAFIPRLQRISKALVGARMDKKVHTERTMLDLLHLRYNAQPPGYPARYILAEHVRNDANFATRTADLIVQDSHKGGHDYALHGFEVKVSRSDWLAELRQPTKAEAFRPYMDFWWLVVPDKAIVQPNELPGGWGLLTIRGDWLARVVDAPKNHGVALMPKGMQVALLRSVLKTKQPGIAKLPSDFSEVADG